MRTVTYLYGTKYLLLNIIGKYEQRFQFQPSIEGKLGRALYAQLSSMREKPTESQVGEFILFLEKNRESIHYDIGYAEVLDDSGNIEQVVNRISFIDKEVLRNCSSSCYTVFSKDCTFHVTREFKTISFICGVNCDHTTDLLLASLVLSESEAVFTEEMTAFETFNRCRVASHKLVFFVDQDEGNINAICNVLGERAVVRLCLYHLTENFVQRFGGALNGLRDFDLSVPYEAMSKDGLLHIATAYNLMVSTKTKKEILEVVVAAVREDKGRKLGKTTFTLLHTTTHSYIIFHTLTYSYILLHTLTTLLLTTHHLK